MHEHDAVARGARGREVVGELHERGVVELARRSSVIDDVPIFTTASIGALTSPLRT